MHRLLRPFGGLYSFEFQEDGHKLRSCMLCYSQVFTSADCTVRDFHQEEGPIVAANTRSNVNYERCTFQGLTSDTAGLMLIVAGAKRASILVTDATWQRNKGEQLSMPAADDGTYVTDVPYQVWLESAGVFSDSTIVNSQNRDVFVDPSKPPYTTLRQVGNGPFVIAMLMIFKVCLARMLLT